jgi:hypothetical protein
VARPREGFSGCTSRSLHSSDVASVRFVCFRCFRGMLQVFPYGCYKNRSGCCICCNRCTRILQMSVFNVSFVFQMHVANVFIWMLHMFHTYVASVLSGCCVCFAMFFKCLLGVCASISDACFKCFICLQTYISNAVSGCFKSRSGVLHMLQPVAAAGGREGSCGAQTPRGVKPYASQGVRTDPTSGRPSASHA